MAKSNAELITGMTREEVIEGLRSKKIHPHSREVATHQIPSQEIARTIPPPNFMVGCLRKIPEEQISIYDLELNP